MTSRLVFVAMAAPYADIKYGFRTTVKESTSTILGHQALVVDTPVTGLIFKANTPKPRRASRRTATGLESSFIAPSAVAAAVAAGFDITKARPNGRKSRTQFQIPVYVTVNGVKYAWGMRVAQKAKLGANFAALGIKEATGAEQDLVFGASFPKPPRAESIVTSKNGSVSSSTFYDPTNESQVAGKFRTEAGQYTAAAWADFV
ncbi:hypothetical protein H6F44_11850 [Pseudanabaena sp. FACHB-1277]|uniref:Uncharacterized protein n=1 Tax=Pseudanabaena cinerea FACHB-1277 TaxID=2949581 RepID=A0A926UU93_9CYAN|nr:hypothetical protein [Pseudanabaena cinerea]MBD2150808.1 hypothetical protein [Pseudanabaena cinerea FACHB-1277]